jgi:hypothetical protein
MKKRNRAVKCVRKRWKNFCVVFFCKKNLARDIAVLILLIAFSGIFLVGTRHWQKIGVYFSKKDKGRNENIQESKTEKVFTEEENVQKQEESVPTIQAKIDTSFWMPYQNLWYGFSLKYPNTWLDPMAKKPAIGEIWDQKVEFRPKETQERNPFEGFDVEVYSIAKIKQLSGTDEFPQLKNEELRADDSCSNLSGHLLETGDYPAEEVYVLANDACFNATLFFTNTRGEYIYVIVPKIKNGAGLAGDPAGEISGHLPEFFSVAKEWNLIDIRRPKPLPPKPRIVAPLPASFDVVGGRRVCAKKNDKPSKSNQHKGKHMDMECCLDPDEYPNPNCYYSPQKYGKYL